MNSDIDISELFSKAMENPEMLARAAEIAKSLSGSGLFSKDDEKSGTDSRPREEKKEPLPIKGDRIQLLEALKPFVREDKRDKIDMVIKLMKIASLAGGSGLLR